MSSEGAAFQAAQQRHHHYMVFGKKQRYIEVFQCSGEDMNHVLTGGTATVSSAASGSNIPVTSSTVTSSPVKDSTSVAQAAAAAAAAATNGLLPPGMFTVPPATSQTPLGLDPNSAILAAAQAAHAGQQATLQNPLLFPYPRQPQPTPNAEMFGMQLMPNLGLRQPQMGLMAYNPAMAAAAANPALLQMQMQQQLLQSQLAAQRFLLTPQQQHAGQHAGQQAAAGLIGPQIPNKRSFDQAFQGSEDGSAKRTSYGTPTISAGPTTYSR